MMKDLSRQETAERWDARWKAGERDWDHRCPAPPFDEFVERHGCPRGKVLIPGCGAGHEVRYFAGLGAEVTGLDVSSAAIRVAARENPHAKAQYRVGNFLDSNPSLEASFDWVIEHTCLCSMNPDLWSDYVASVKKALKPEGYFLALFYRRPKYENPPPFGIADAELVKLFGGDFKLLDAWIPENSFESRAGREELRWYRRF